MVFSQRSVAENNILDTLVFVSVSFFICKPEAVMNVSRKSQEIILQKILTFQTRKPLIDTLKDCKINNFSNVLKRPKD